METTTQRRLQVGQYTIGAYVDNDGHLTLWIEADDGTKIHAIGDDISSNDQEWIERFTTESIESLFANHFNN